MALYSGVLLHELHLSNMIYIKRKWNVEAHEDNLVLLKEADRSLKEAKSILKNEQSSVSGEKLYHLLGSSEKDTNRWMERYRINLSEQDNKANKKE